MTNYSKLQNLTKDDINIRNNDLFVKDVKLGGPFIAIFFGKNSGLNNDHKKTILSYFLSSKDLINYNYDRSTNEYKVFFKRKTLFKPVKVFHDPEKDESFWVHYNFRSLLNLQDHTFRHCIADHWINQGSQVPDLIEKDETFFNGFWNKFREINCNFFLDITLSDIDTHEKAKNVIKNLRYKIFDEQIKNTNSIRKEKTPTGKNSEELKKIQDVSGIQNLCQNCINKHNGPDTFLKCWKLLSDNNIHELYLSRIREWIVESIQDQKNIEHYKNNTTNGLLERRHLHYRQDGNVKISSYALEYKDNKDCHIFYLVLRKYGNTYNLLTAYPLRISKKPVTEIHSYTKNQSINKDLKILNFCHTSNWIGVRNLLCGN